MADRTRAWAAGWLCAAALFGGALRATADDQPVTPEGVAFFEKKIRPVLVKQCYQCHSSTAKQVRGGLLLDTRAAILKGGSSGVVVVPGDPENSPLIKAVRHADDVKPMPPKSQLAAAEIRDLEAWVKMGVPVPETAKTSSGVDVARGKDWWSLRPVARVKPPPVKDVSWPLNDVDHFILAKLEEKGLRPVRPADPRTLVRRATFDLIGLPPTPEEVEAFVKTSSTNPRAAYEELIDRLLASPAFGERWGRHWLDVVRYADTAGDNSDYPIPQLFKYRNWVIDAVNADLPYDQFVREQLAGDLMPAASERERQDKLIATGYLANSHRFGSYEDDRYPWHLTIEDTIDNLGRTFLGLTINCARCHDHKFDPISQEDYYALYGFFSSTRYPWPGIELDKVQRDLVPLAPADEVEAFLKERSQKLAALDAEIKKQEKEKADEKVLKDLRKERDTLAKSRLPFEMVYAVAEGKTEGKKKVGNACVQIKGDPEHPGKEVPRRFPTVLGGQGLPPDEHGSGRLRLAEWIADPKNPLTARVMVNRLWHYHFGRGIVPTPSDFGKQGRPATHAELLDYLATQFVEEGWSVKAMHRLIMLSRTYQLSSEDNEANAAVDVGNDLLWRFRRQRLDAEAIRDAMLAVGGGLDRSRGGEHPFPDPTTWDFTQHKPFKAVYDSDRRSVYLMTQRIQRHPFLGLFDGPDTNASTASRITSTTPLQALFFMNDPFAQVQAKKFAARIQAEGGDDAARVERTFLLAFGRSPADEERSQSLEYVKQVREKLPADQSAKAWESFARALLMSNEFVYVN